MEPLTTALSACLTTIASILLVSPATIVIEVCVGLALLGPICASMHESLVHQYIAHAKRETVNFWRRHPRIFLTLLLGHFFHHVVHHGKTFREGYLKQFGRPLEHEDVDAWAPEAFYKAFPAEHQAYIRKAASPAAIIEKLHASEYGLGAASPCRFALTIVPLVLVVLLVAPFWLAFGTGASMLFLYPAMSCIIHRNMMHVPQVAGGGRVQNILTKFLVGSAYMKWLERYHWLHHRYVYCNYNLLVFADFLRGTWRRATAADLEKMQTEGLDVCIS
ncbi:MAG: hypothetical protein P4L53_04815 [Candidatus Obscuribacterales bacterium]|nr:hypothetical protein [Candidatus Obscuribacterales bacterium]